MKVLVLGASGLVGSACALAALRRGHSVVGAAHRSPVSQGVEALPLDATDEDAVTRACLDLWPDTIVNAAAVSAAAEVDAAPEHAARLNVALPRHLAQLSSHIGARFLHLSTDLVFAGGDDPLATTALPEPSNLYGRQKLQAEREVLEHNTESAAVLRITLVSGNSPSGNRSLHENLLHAIARGERPGLFEDEIRQPSSAGNIAEVLVELAERHDLNGILHWAGSEALSRYAIGRRILEHLHLQTDLVEPVRKRDNPDFAGRPSALRFDLRPLAGKLKTRPSSVQDILEEIRVPVELSDWYDQARQNR